MLRLRALARQARRFRHEVLTSSHSQTMSRACQRPAFENNHYKKNRRRCRREDLAKAELSFHQSRLHVGPSHFPVALQLAESCRAPSSGPAAYSKTNLHTGPLL